MILLLFGDEFTWSGCPLGFYESFNDDSANNWLRTAPWSVSDGVYKMIGIHTAARLVCQYCYYNQFFDDFSFEASVKQIEGDQGYRDGNIFQKRFNFNNRYSFFITAVGQYTIVKTVNGDRLRYWFHGLPVIIFTGYNVWNRLGITCTGSTADVFHQSNL